MKRKTRNETPKKIKIVCNGKLIYDFKEEEE
jgi:hypothetical protein